MFEVNGFKAFEKKKNCAEGDCVVCLKRWEEGRGYLRSPSLLEPKRR